MLYYAHSLRIYGTDIERNELLRIRLLKCQRILNPRDLLRGVADWKETAFSLIRRARCVVFTTYCDTIGKGVYTELMYAFEIGKPVFQLVGWRLVPVGRDQISVIYGRTGSWVYYAKIDVPVGQRS